MKLRFVWVGKTRRRAIRELLDDYLGRIEKFARLEVTEIRDRVDADPRRAIEKEGEDLLAAVCGEGFVVALDERGREMDSLRLAEFIERHRIGGTRRMAFLIGGHGGLSNEVRKRADFVLALSKMTLTHEMARLLLAEQIYRAYTIIHDLPYQK